MRSVGIHASLFAALLTLSSFAAAQGAPTSPPPPTPPATTPTTAPPAPPAAPAPVDEIGLRDDAPPAPAPSTPAPPAPAPSTPAPAPTTSAPAAPVAQEEPREVDGWTLVSLLSGRRTPEGAATEDACGYVRDVVVEKITDKTPVTARALLRVPCIKGDNGLPQPGKPSLDLPEHLRPRAPSSVGINHLEVGVVGALAQDDARFIIEKHQAELVPCAKGRKGELAFKVVIGKDGKPTEVRAIEGTFMKTPAEACIIAAARTWVFPIPLDGAVAIASYGVFFDGAPLDAPAVASATPPAATKATAMTTAGKPVADGKAPPPPPPPPPACKPGEKPKDAAALKSGEQACVEPRQRPCAEGEKPLAQSDLPDDQRPCKDEPIERGVPFYKGELSHLGDVQLVNARSSFGVGLGFNVIDGVWFAVARPDVNVKVGNFSLGLGAPLRFEIADTNQVSLSADAAKKIFGNFGRFRTEDWDQMEDFVRPLRYLTWGRKEDNLYIDVNRVHALTIGHGQLVRRYQPNLDIDEDNLFAGVDGYGDWGGVELMAGPFPLPRLAGGLVFVKPLGFTTPAEDKSWAAMVARTFSVGLTYVTDLNVPTGLIGRQNPADGRFQLAVDRANQLLWRSKVDPIGQTVQGMGIDAETKLLKLDNVDIKVYGDYSHLFFPADNSDAGAFDSFSGGGLTAGGLLRVSFGEQPVRPIDDETEEVRLGKKPRERKAAHAFRVRLEGRSFAPTFLPSYFNTMYEVDRFQFGHTDDGIRASLPTKVGFLASKQDAPWRAGFYSEATYAWVDHISFTAAYEHASPVGGDDATLNARNFALHAETQGLGWLQLFATYHYRNFDDFNGAFKLNSDNEVVYAGARLQLLPILFINLASQRSFRTGFGPDDQAKQFDDAGLRYTSVGLANAWVNSADIEFGWQF